MQLFLLSAGLYIGLLIYDQTWIAAQNNNNELGGCDYMMRWSVMIIRVTDAVARSRATAPLATGAIMGSSTTSVVNV